VACIQLCSAVYNPKTAQDAAVQVFREFDINVEESALLSRCSKCNGEFIDRFDQPDESVCN